MFLKQLRLSIGSPTTPADIESWTTGYFGNHRPKPWGLA